jgi:hypothetical protein
MTMMTSTTTVTAPVTSDILPASCPAWDAARELRTQDEREAAFQALAAAPEVGMPATINHYSDRDAATIIAVSKSGRVITVREDHAKLLNGFNSGAADALEFSPGGFVGHTSGTQRYAYRTNLDGKVTQFSRRERTVRGKRVVSWVEVGRKRGQGSTLSIGVRAHNYDFNF